MSSSSSSSLPLIPFTHLHPHHKTPSHFKTNICFTPRKPHICFTFSNKNSSNYEREESRWLREEQRWLREEQRWFREQERWESEKEGLMNEIKGLRDEIEVLRNNDGNLVRILKKEVSQIAEKGSSGVPFVVEGFEDVEVVKEVVEDVKEVKVKEVEVKEVKEVKKKVMAMLRVGSEGDQVQTLQEALLKQGFYCGEEDEEFSSFSTGTERAVKTWQSSIGVPETGVMTVELLERLFMDSGFKENANVAAATSVIEVPEIPTETVKEDPKAYVSDDRVYLLGENRYEDSSRLKKNGNSLTQTSSKGVVTTKCITCRGEGVLLCLECDGTGEPNIEPQFLEWVGEDTKCPYCEGNGHTNCDACQGTGVGAA